MLTFELPIALPDHAAVLVSAVPYLGTIVFPAITADDLCREWTQAVMVPPFGFTDCHLRLHLFPLVRINDRRVALLRQVLCDPVERLALHEKRVDLPTLPPGRSQAGHPPLCGNRGKKNTAL